MTNNWIREHPALISSILLGVGSTGMLLFHRKAIVQKICSWRLVRSVKAAERTVHVVTCEEGWAKVQPLLLREAQQDGAVGFDCEWVQAKGHRRPVALLQLAACSGLCILLRLSHMKPNFPNTLKSFLEDKTILKVGVGSLEDSNFLAADYNLKVQGCVDLRYLVLQCRKSQLSSTEVTPEAEKLAAGMGLNALSQAYLGLTLDKDWRIRASNWEAETLSKRQESYAADDALVGIHILMRLMEKLWVPSSLLIPILPSMMWHYHLSTAIHQTCHSVLDVKFSYSGKQLNAGVAPNSRSAPSAKLKSISRAYSTRKGPLYHNCQLRAPDDQPLCTCDPKKAQWYIEKGLGVLISEDPLIVRLKFEPAGRPQVERDDGKFYLQERHNICVVCGEDESYIRKNVVPHEYRKHFPDILKDHQSHDVVLLCLECHRLSNLHDNALRYLLAKEFKAPIGTEQDVKVTIDHTRKIVRNAAGALLRSQDNIPEKRVKELESIVKNYFNIEEISVKHLQDGANLDVKILNEGYQAHGEKVYEAYKKVGLVKLEQRWRQHFLDTMNPLFMPECWSLTHNVYKMQLKMSQWPLDHPERFKYKIILVGSEGTIDIPYCPQTSKATALVNSTLISKDDSPGCPLPSVLLHCGNGNTKTISERQNFVPVANDSFQAQNSTEVAEASWNTNNIIIVNAAMKSLNDIGDESYNSELTNQDLILSKATTKFGEYSEKNNKFVNSDILTTNESHILNTEMGIMQLECMNSQNAESMPYAQGIDIEVDVSFNQNKDEDNFNACRLPGKFEMQNFDLDGTPMTSMIVVSQDLAKKKADVDLSPNHNSKIEKIHTTDSVFSILCEDVNTRGEMLHYDADQV
ncbi:exonuclease 3'-5' domain-containing protein 2 [Procambarus clarkii]|uniref:exonuclease 3'-5' domain-containing protein 2 n=1 Tax=Procambarus clarkii TaxID=6728 RepID=UPI003743301A